jgi:hypothetical protein
LKHALFVSVAKIYNLARALPSLSLAAKFANLAFKLDSQVQTWQTSQKELVENILRSTNLAAKLELGRPHAKFEFGCQVQNMAKTEKRGRIKCHT